jgi:hypothetical protein
MHKALLALAVASSLATPSSLLGSFGALLDSFWHMAPVAKIGCGADPDGRCVPDPSPRTQKDIGCGMDPDGRCHSGS